MSPSTSLHVKNVEENVQHLRKAVPHHTKEDRDLSMAGNPLAEVHPHPHTHTHTAHTYTHLTCMTCEF